MILTVILNTVLVIFQVMIILKLNDILKKL